MPVSRQGATVRFGEATLVRSDIPCTNGMLHIVDRLAREFSHAT
jgi:hypothetical protein